MGLYIKLEFQLIQHSRDESLIRSLVNYFGCGNFYIRQGKDFLSFRCTKFSDIENRIIPFFQEYNILGVKAKDFSDWCCVAQIMKNKGHLSREGLDLILELKAGMNKRREIK